MAKAEAATQFFKLNVILLPVDMSQSIGAQVYGNEIVRLIPFVVLDNNVALSNYAIPLAKVHSLRQIEIVKALAKHHHFGLAAKALRVSQPGHSPAASSNSRPISASPCSTGRG